jgi:hypothetical protein
VTRIRTRHRLLLSSVGVAAAIAVAIATPVAARASASKPVPVLAYYYIWYDPGSWSRAKTDYPLLGRYSSDSRKVLEQHVRWAQSSGVDGFIVSWKHTPALDARLTKLVAIADRLHFKLAIIYQGLDFYRRPLPAARVGADLRYFESRFGDDDAFRIYSKPLVIWSGTWKFTAAQVDAAVAPVRNRLLVLASEKNVKGYQRLAGLVDGDAYYWSSVDPQTFPGYPNKLVQMSAAVHRHLGLWIAPAAPGFDARLVGGHIIVPRRNGATLREELDGAQSSSPDAIGLISWNEFSENSAVEPSTKYGKTYLHVLADALGGASPSVQDFNSDSAVGSSGGYGVEVAIGAGACLLALLAIVFVRSGRRRNRRPAASVTHPSLEDR